MKRPRVENKCTNCRRRHTCRLAQGVVVWKNCGWFKPGLIGEAREVSVVTPENEIERLTALLKESEVARADLGKRLAAAQQKLQTCRETEAR